MKLIPLSNVSPNQKFDIVLDGQTFTLSLRTIQDYTLIDISINGTRIISSSKCVDGSLIIPAKYLQNGFGNFFFVTINDEYPYFEEFGANHFLWYLSSSEIEGLTNNV